MRTIRRVGGLAVAGLLLGAVVSGPAASADTPAAYAGSASAQALKLSLGSGSLTAGISEAKAASDGTGAATGTGSITPAGVTGNAKAANPPGETKPEICGAAGAPPAPLNVLSLGLACGTAAATGTGLTSVASARGEVARLDVTANTVLAGPLAPVTGPLTTTVGSTTTTVCAALPVAPLQDACKQVTGTINEIVQSLVSTQTLSLDAGNSTSRVSVAGNTVTSEGTASGAVIALLPNATLNGTPVGGPLATITVARAEAKVLCDLASGTATPSFDPALVRVKLSAPVVALLPALPNLIPGVTLVNGEFTIAPGQSQTILAGTPLQTEIVVGAGKKTVNPDGTASAVSDGVKVHALQLIGSTVAPLAGGLLFDLAHAEAAGGCVAATVTPVETPRAAAPEVPQQLPRTGGTPWMPIVGVAGLALVVISRRALRSN